MALSLDQLRNQILTSFFGRRAGHDSNDFYIGSKEFRVQVEDITTTAASTLANYGISVLKCTIASSAVYTLATPPVGLQAKQIIQTSSSTLGYAIRAQSGVNFVTSAGSSFNQLTAQGVGAYIELTAISSTQLIYKLTGNTQVVASTF